MPRTLHRSGPVFAVSLVLGLLAYVGCSSRDSDQRTAPGSGASPTTDTDRERVVHAPTSQKTGGPEGRARGSEPARPARKLFEGWPDPAAALVISGEQLGYLEPCGCTEGQTGGLLRRFELVERLRGKRKWPLALIDLGSVIKDPATARGGPEQSKIKFHVALKALTLLGYSALALSPEDLKVGIDEAVGQFLNLPDTAPKVVAANVAAPGLEARIVPSVRVPAGPVKIGITAVVDPETLRALKDPALDLLQIKPIDETLPAVLADLEKTTDTQVLLVQGAPEMARTLAGKYAGFDIIVGTAPYPDPAQDAERVNNGNTLVLNVGQRGKYTGVVGLFPGSDTPARYQLVTLGTEFDGPATPMKTLIEGEYRETLKQQAVVERFPKHGFIGAGDATFVGVDACKKCHPNTVEFWASTGHARAFESLVHDPKPNTIYDVECITCHTTGFEYTSGWKSPETTPYLKGNQCENCHGPASKHVADPLNKAFRAPMHLTTRQADQNRLCLRCHDEDNSPHFEFAKYWDEINHDGLDNPKEHLDNAQPKVKTGG